MGSDATASDLRHGWRCGIGYAVAEWFDEVAVTNSRPSGSQWATRSSPPEPGTSHGDDRRRLGPGAVRRRPFPRGESHFVFDPGRQGVPPSRATWPRVQWPRARSITQPRKTSACPTTGRRTRTASPRPGGRCRRAQTRRPKGYRRVIVENLRGLQLIRLPDRVHRRAGRPLGGRGRALVGDYRRRRDRTGRPGLDPHPHLRHRRGVRDRHSRRRGRRDGAGQTVGEVTLTADSPAFGQSTDGCRSSSVDRPSNCGEQASGQINKQYCRTGFI